MSFPSECLPSGRRSVPCLGHSFGEGLHCRCGISWWSQQRTPTACPMRAQQMNGAKAESARPQAEEAPR